MTEFAHITPTAYLDLFASGRPFHLTLAHLVEEDPVYTNWYAQRDLSRGLDPYVNIMDNSAFEMYKQGREMYPSEKLIEMGTKVAADYIVMSDYPGQPSQVTIEKAIEMAPELREAGFGTFFVPQSSEGDLEDLIDAFVWASTSDHVDYIGVSILAVPIAYGVEKENKLQRFMSRWKFMQELDKRGILDDIKDNGKKIHFLGMVDGPNECTLVQDYLWAIDSWDSSAAVWAGMCGIEFDNSPTGLIDGKNEIEVDFDHDSGDIASIALAMKNMKYIDDQLPSGDYYDY
jgi:hypothetical protein